MDLVNHAFLVAVARDAAPEFRELLTGIADWYRDCSSLSPKQLASVKLSAKFQGRSVPPGLLVEMQEPPPLDLGGTVLHAAADDIRAVLADLCSEIGNAFTRAAERLR